MSSTTDSDLKDLKDLIISKFDKFETKLDKLSEEVNDIKIDMATLKESQKSLDRRLDEVQSSINKRLDDSQLNIGKRLDNLDFIARTVIGGVVLALIAGLAKILYPNLMG